jgi:hypothetical protein
MAAEYNRGMDSELEAVFRMLDDAVEQAKSIRIEVDEEYVRAIELAEALPQNQSGASKDWVWRMDRAFRDHYKHAKQLR